MPLQFLLFQASGPSLIVQFFALFLSEQISIFQVLKNPGKYFKSSENRSFGIGSSKKYKYNKAELLQQLKTHPFICMINFISKKVGNRKN